MNYLLTVMLYCINQLNGERSINAVFYLIKGKKATQTIQDTVWYSLKKIFYSYPELTLSQFNEHVKILRNNQWIETNDKSVTITKLGKDYLEKSIAKQPIPTHLNGWLYHPYEKLFWQRLSLIVQTLSNWTVGETKFYPVQRDYLIQNWVKQWFYLLKKQYKKEQLAHNLSVELFNLFQFCEEKKVNPVFIVYKLSGYQKPGLTTTQLADFLLLDEGYSTLSFRSSLHFIISTLWNESQQYPLLHSMVADRFQPIVLSNSSKYTFELVNKGKTIDEIVMIRKLKRSTIEDHLIEIALKDSEFPIQDYVKPAIQDKIMTIVNQLQTRKLTKIKEKVEEADYFTIRLVLSKME